MVPAVPSEHQEVGPGPSLRMPNRVEKGYVGTEDLGSWQAADPVSCGSVQARAEDLCELCGKHLYVLERFCVDGHFFHRGCFCCHTCEVTLWPGGYGQHPGDGKWAWERLQGLGGGEGEGGWTIGGNRLSAPPKL